MNASHAALVPTKMILPSRTATAWAVARCGSCRSDGVDVAVLKTVSAVPFFAVAAPGSISASTTTAQASTTSVSLASSGASGYPLRNRLLVDPWPPSARFSRQAALQNGELLGQRLVASSRAPFTRHLLAEVDPRERDSRPAGRSHQCSSPDCGVRIGTSGESGPPGRGTTRVRDRVRVRSTPGAARKSTVCWTIAYGAQLQARGWWRSLPRRCQPRHGWTREDGRSGRVRDGNRETAEPELAPATSWREPECLSDGVGTASARGEDGLHRARFCAPHRFSRPPAPSLGQPFVTTAL